MVAPEDFGLAGRGELSALRRLRDYWFRLADGECAIPFLPKDEAQPQAELLAELAAGSGQAEDLVALIVAYQLRTEALTESRNVHATCAKAAAEAENVNLREVDYWNRTVSGFEDRLRFYRSKLDELLEVTFADTEGAALMVAALTVQADNGDERAPPMLQQIMDSVTPERARAIQAQVRKLEKEAAQ